ncbi:nucleotidyltransferase domain-containing protein [Streptomyces sp. NP160]|uniref:nucleotidyltransferase domain-containing protein n=1 Tax=Streptomyces sp. NP160 TaxID=2586637 RepID=UPI00111A00AB|nr:nucleotidyltransferase domain-containing protein [Streptomyces sp. NP160]TNM60187.1 nucleotidyltransferase domain-containing protein [Streptomyces sp. NP160]
MTPEVQRYLSDLVEAARSVLAGDLVGVYAAGSLALDAFHAGRSDIDVAVVCAGPLTDDTRRALVARWRHSALPCPARGLELVVYTDAVARSGTAEPGFELELNDGPAMDFRQTLHPRDRRPADGTFWYGLDRSILHQSGRVLAGPPAAEVFTDLSETDLRGLLVDSLQWWMALPAPAGGGPAAGADDAVLGACRALVRVREGVWRSKVDAGRRLVATGSPSAEVIEQSVAARTAGAPPPSGAAAKAFQRSVLEEVSTSG